MYVTMTLAEGVFYATAVSFNGRVVAWSKDPAQAEKLTLERASKVGGYYQGHPKGRKVRFVENLGQELQPVGIEADGTVKAIEELSYAHAAPLG